MTNPEQDALGYGLFAQMLARAIQRVEAIDGIVLAVYGPWGSGKTTLLNFVQHYLDQVPIQQRPIPVAFNPWWFSGYEDLARYFFDHLHAGIRDAPGASAELRKRAADLLEGISKLPLPSVIPYAGSGKAAAKVAAQLLRPSKKTVRQLKKDLADELRRQGRKIVVTIDDIDRLTAREIRQLFKTIKAVGDLPNVVYLLSFDRNVVAKALRRSQGTSGEAYLEKIVQVPFELPVPDRTALSRMFTSRLDRILESTPDGLFSTERWTLVYHHHLHRLMATPRAVARALNALTVSYPAVVGEVNAVDFVAMELIRVFLPQLYDAIRDHPDDFAGYLDTPLDADARGEEGGLRARHDEWLGDVPLALREHVREAIMELFPKLGGVWRGRLTGTGSEATWERESRIASRGKTSVYFRLAVPEGAFSNREMEALISMARDGDAFRARLLELSREAGPVGGTRFRSFAERLDDYAGGDGGPIDGDLALAIVSALLDIGDELIRPEDDRRGQFGAGNDVIITSIVRQLMRRIDHTALAQPLHEAFSSGGALSIMVEVLSQAMESHDRALAPLLNDLRSLALDRVQRAAADGTLLRAPELAHILYRWRDWAGADEVDQWVARTVRDDQQLASFVSRFVVGGKLSMRDLAVFVRPSGIADRATKAIRLTDLNDLQRTAVAQFVEIYGSLERGEDPDDPATWTFRQRRTRRP